MELILVSPFIMHSFVCVCMLVYVCKTDNQEKKEPDAGPAVQTVVQILHLVAASFSTGLLPS